VFPIVALHGNQQLEGQCFLLLRYMVTKSWKVSVSVLAGCVKGKQYTERVLVRRPSELVSGISASVSLRQFPESKRFSARSEKPVFRRVSVVSGVRSLSLYLVVSYCVSYLIIVICVVIIALANKSGIQSEPSSCY
jgi:hypothetical protein